MEEEGYVKFYTRNYTSQKIYFNNINFYLKKVPYYYGNYLYIPVEILMISKSEPIGLLNLGGVCYMNALLQCFYYIKELQFDDKPNYQYLKSLLGKIYDKNNFNYDMIFEIFFIW